MRTRYVALVLGLAVASFVVIAWPSHPRPEGLRDPRKLTARAIRTASCAIEGYSIDEGHYPRARGNLRDIAGALVPKYAHELTTRDAWGREMTYASEGTAYIIASAGQDGAFGGAVSDDIDDIRCRDGTEGK